MSESTDLAQSQSAELERLEQGASGAIEQEKQESGTVPPPRLAIVQPTTQNPPEGASPGDFVNQLLEESYGPSVEFVVVRYGIGRMFVDDEDQVFVASGAYAPQNWPEEYAGRAFDEVPDAHEQYSVRANAGEIEWGSGPPIVTLHNFVGFVVGEGGSLDIPVRLSLKRSDARVAGKIKTLVNSRRQRWERVIDLSTERKSASKGTWFAVRAKFGRDAEPDERLAAVRFFHATAARDLADAGDAEVDEAPAVPEPTPSGALDVN